MVYQLPLSMVYRSPTHGISIPYTWYIDPYPWDIDSPPHGISNTLLMVYRAHYSWYIEPTTHGILTIPSHGISTTLPMVF